METKNKFILTGDTTTIIELHKNEMQLLHAIRNQWRFGEITIIVRDGLPVRLKRVEEFIDLSTDEKNLTNLKEL
jgi:c-di-AMP phosphodiesterase-like protein